MTEEQIENFRFEREDDYEYKIFSILSTERARARASVILAGKRGRHRHSTTGLARMSQWREQVVKCKKFYNFAIGKGLNLLEEE